ncbi:FAD:protein FMN transferase [Paenibacillus sp. N1-5-1-14]|uniref:FAD:protein FMN transferase n=1 Tax=Paenibacillus radicibacter TaxID=2972488 RepID=UPI0021596856|nr:FAD:protein FMN transferase [Paenibacillus radicibacter]MCR8645269.1 FAD:protein FMN transferase [Paenibacillus radicibacter]
MGMLTKKQVLSVIVCLSLLLLTACGGKSASDKTDQPKVESYFIFDTLVTLKVYSKKVTDQHFKEMHELMKDIDLKMNREHAGGELNKVNAQAGKEAVQVSKETFDVVKKAFNYSELSKGYFDFAIGPLVDLWQIGKEGAHVPAKNEIAHAATLVNYKEVTLDEANHTIKLNKEGMSIDLGGIGKGYAADKLADYLRDHGMDSAIIDLGGNIYAVGSKVEDRPWNIGIQDPNQARGNQIGKMKITDQTVVTSGVYERFFVENGVHYHHILDPHTGYPVKNNINSVTIVTKHSTDADALSTTAFALGIEEGLKLMNSLEGVEALFITNENKIYATTGIKEKFELTDKKFQWAN